MKLRKLAAGILYSPLNAKNALVKCPLLVLSGIFYICARFRIFLYKKNVFRRQKYGFKIISVGGITVGGEGKTTITMRIAEHFLKRSCKTGVIVGNKAADEAALIKQNAGADVYMADRKFLAARGIKEKDVVIIDDGFQHFALRRDLDVVVVSPVVLQCNFLLPAGPLREPLSSLKRADIVIINNADSEQKKELLDIVRPFKSTDDIFFSGYRLEYLFDSGGKRLPADFISGKRVLIFSGIGNPAGFRKLVSESGAVIKEEKVFPDHYSFTQDDLSRIQKDAAGKDAEFVVTTAKDFIRIKEYKGSLRLLVAGIYPHMDNEDKFLEKLDHVFK